MVPGNANLPIGVAQFANREIGVPGVQSQGANLSSGGDLRASGSRYAARLRSSSFVGEVEDLCFEEQAVQLRVEFLVLHRHFQDIESAVGGHGFFVRTVGGGEGVENIANRHDLRLDGDFITAQFVGVACPI